MKKQDKQETKLHVITQKLVGNKAILNIEIDLTDVLAGNFAHFPRGTKLVNNVPTDNTYQIIKQQSTSTTLCGLEGLTFAFYLSQNIDKVAKQAERAEQISELKALGWTDEKIARFLSK